MTMVIRNKELKDFTKWYFKQPGMVVKVPENSLKMLQNSTEFVIYRDGQIQVELIFIRPGVIVPPQVHPNVDTYEYPMEGVGAHAIVDGKVIPPQHPDKRKSRFIPLARGVPHSAFPGVGPGLGLVSVQYWHENTPPTFITDDWLGAEWI